MIDADGFRANVGIILTNDAGRVFWARRIGQNSWQFPQGGIKPHETAEQALFRELQEEVGLSASGVTVLGVTDGWLRYKLPKKLIRYNSHPVCVGQKQKWFLLRLTDDESAIEMSSSPKPEFDGWSWVNYWYPLSQVVVFKREVYRSALRQLLPHHHRTLQAATQPTLLAELRLTETLAVKRAADRRA
ncbi:RNA pyrophosphohydrolase [Allohahella marinimesophila]|uniref:RNA pyrophosphohydrolase n=1 Tax=Allohahella marinimesophila TaxID=1054972 RepID=A0ABP7PJM9_9GAMM